MINNSIEEALKLEANGDIFGALRICRIVLRREPNHTNARILFNKLNLSRRIKYEPNLTMLELFMSDKIDDISKFKEWLVNL